MEITRAVAAVGHAADACAQVDLDTVPTRGTSRSRRVPDRDVTPRSPVRPHRPHRQQAGAHLGTGARDTAEWIGKQTGTSTAKNRAAADLGEAMAKSEPLADAVTTGRISNDKANAAVGAAGGMTLDAELVDEITTLPLNSVRPAAENWRAHNNAPREADRAARQRSRRYLRLTSTKDGMTRVDGLLDPESAAIARTTLDAIMNQSAFDDSRRRRDQRCADALTQLAKAASKGKILGGRSNAKMLVTVPFETVIERGTARGVTHAGPTIDAETVRHMACDAGIHRVITGPGSSILDFGRENRLVSDNLFLALVARDQHCRWPDCTIRATWCDAHHVTEWGHHGRTNELDVRTAVSPPPLAHTPTRLVHHRQRPRVHHPPPRRHHPNQPTTNHPTSTADNPPNNNAADRTRTARRCRRTPSRCKRPRAGMEHRLRIRAVGVLVMLTAPDRVLHNCVWIAAEPTHRRGTAYPRLQ